MSCREREVLGKGFPGEQLFLCPKDQDMRAETVFSEEQRLITQGCGVVGADADKTVAISGWTGRWL